MTDKDKPNNNLSQSYDKLVNARNAILKQIVYELKKFHTSTATNIAKDLKPIEAGHASVGYGIAKAIDEKDVNAGYVGTGSYYVATKAVEGTFNAKMFGKFGYIKAGVAEWGLAGVVADALYQAGYEIPKHADDPTWNPEGFWENTPFNRLLNTLVKKDQKAYRRDQLKKYDEANKYYEHQLEKYSLRGKFADFLYTRTPAYGAKIKTPKKSSGDELREKYGLNKHRDLDRYYDPRNRTLILNDEDRLKALERELNPYKNTPKTANSVIAGRAYIDATPPPQMFPQPATVRKKKAPPPPPPKKGFWGWLFDVLTGGGDSGPNGMDATYNPPSAPSRTSSTSVSGTVVTNNTSNSNQGFVSYYK